MNMISKLKGVGVVLLLFVAVYAPAFAAVAWLHHKHLWCGDKLGRLCPSVQVTIPLIIIVSAGMALLFTAILARGTKGIAEFGVAKSPTSYVIAAVLAGIVVGGALAYLAARYPAPSPLDLSKLPSWSIFVFFILAAPVQEEFIFRGLLQTTMARAVSVQGSFWAVHFPVVFVAALFGVIHLGSGIVVAAGAILLGLIAGELRRLSASLVPAILVHALFNAASLWSTG
ncbi:MAG: CPBP family intramembrane metalloprotease [Alphaproteobacteria bacterium]|nr:CPBP family intramembrane metalloprotease [Alphaproteobacteria bacterium]MDE2629602.1 CPBP family intramembrane metalloprotease [Alphaproteobacteria bacterium]